MVQKSKNTMCIEQHFGVPIILCIQIQDEKLMADRDLQSEEGGRLKVHWGLINPLCFLVTRLK